MFDRDLWREAQIHGSLLPLTIALNAAITGCVIVQSYVLSRIVAGVFLLNLTFRDVRPLLLLLLAFALLRSLLIALAEGSARSLAGHVKASLRSRLYRRLQARGPAFLQRQRTGELVNTLVEGIESLDAYY
ncbi:MAG TPA: ABC transporter transmembrane domain-containing protein, partial [Candidatus Binatia bacterium]|nr:ABC transporter transmembrane domain-containing protein [Candidatus Binatia bacterium]